MYHSFWKWVQHATNIIATLQQQQKQQKKERKKDYEIAPPPKKINYYASAWICKCRSRAVQNTNIVWYTVRMLLRFNEIVWKKKSAQKLYACELFYILV